MSSHKLAFIPMGMRMGRSPITGYEVWDEGHSLMLIATNPRRPMGHMTSIRLPKEPADMFALCRELMRCAHVFDILGEKEGTE